MIKVKVNYENNKIDNISIKGHAMYDDFGKDIVCASVSSIVITTVNAILKVEDKSISYDDSFYLKVLKDNSVVEILLENMISMLKELETDYPDNIKFL